MKSLFCSFSWNFLH